MDNPEIEEEIESTGSYFWSPPYYSTIKFENEVAEARDGLASERNFLSSVRTAFYMSLAAASVMIQYTYSARRNWIDWTLTALLLGVALLIPLLSLLNYAHSFDLWKREVAAVHTRRSYTLSVVFAAVVAILVMVRELTAAPSSSS